MSKLIPEEKEQLLRKAVIPYRRLKIAELVKKGVNTKTKLGIELKKLGVYFNKKGEVENPNVDRKKNTGKLHHDINMLVKAKILEPLNPKDKEFKYGLGENAYIFLGLMKSNTQYKLKNL